MSVLTAERDRMLRGLPQEATVAKNAWFYADCPKHGQQPHLGVLGGACPLCHQAGLEARGLVRAKG